MADNIKCKDCVSFGHVMLACFNPLNEGMRVFNPNESTCPHAKKK